MKTFTRTFNDAKTLYDEKNEFWFTQRKNVNKLLFSKNVKKLKSQQVSLLKKAFTRVFNGSAFIFAKNVAYAEKSIHSIGGGNFSTFF